MAVAAQAPQYRQVAAELERAIAAGGLRPHDRLASERAIAERHGLSRMTARQAVELLVRRGTVYRRPGSGTFVSPPRVVHTLQRLAGFSEQMRAQGIVPTARVLEMRRTRRVEAAARAALELGPDGGPGWRSASASATASRSSSRRSGCPTRSARISRGASWRRGRSTT